MGRVVEVGVQRNELRRLLIVPVMFLSSEIEKEIPKPFHNDRAKIQGQILFKRREMMQSEVLNNVWGHKES